MAVRGDVFAREGEYWTVAFGGTVSRLRDSKGMAYLAELLARPGEEVSALDLAGAGTVEADAGQVLDQQAVSAYRERAQELRSTLEEAESFGDLERASRARLELDALTEQLSAAVGLGGRRRTSGATSERARVAVTKAIKTAISRINDADPELGRHLEATVRTGTFCCYRPDTRLEPHWADRPAQASARPARPSLARRLAPFVGRERALAALRDAALSASAGAGGLALVSGDPGVGKSRLLDELADGAGTTGMSPVAGRCAETTQALAYLPFIEVFEHVLREHDDGELRRLLGAEAAEISRLVPRLRQRLSGVPVPAEGGGAQAQRLLFTAVGDVLERLAQAGPRLIVLEDVHWADGPSLALLEHLASRIPALPVLVVASYRGAEAAVGTPLGRTLERLIARHDCLRLDLEPLDEDDVTSLVAGLHGASPPARLLERLTADSAGNPFFVEELYQYLADRGELSAEHDPAGLPESIRLVLGHRLERLSPECRDALAIAAVAGQDFDESLLAAAGAAAPTIEGSLDEALAAGLVGDVPGREPGTDRYRFAHALVRRAILGGLSPARRRRLHLALADAIERLHPGDTGHAAELADHLEQAGADVAPLRVALAQQAAARRMLDVAAFDDALARLDRALARCPPGEAQLLAEILADRGNARRALGRMSEAYADWYAALDQGGHRWPRAPRIWRDLARTLDITGRVDEALAAARRGLEVVGGEPTAERSRLLGSLAYTLDLTGEVDEAGRVLEEALAIADRLGDTRVRGDVLAVSVTHCFIGTDHPGEMRAARDASELLVASGELWDAAQATMMRMLSALRRGALDEAEALDPDVEALSRRSGHPIAELWRRRCLEAVRVARTADLAAYAGYADEDVAACRAGGLRWLADALVHAGMCAFWRGDLDVARAHLDEAAATPTPPAYIGRYSSARFLIEAWAGDDGAFERHRSEVERALADAGLAQAQTLGRVIFLLSSAEGHALLGHRDQAAALRAEVDAAAERGMVLRLGDLRLVPALQALTAACAGDFAAADAIAAQTRRLVERVPYRREEPDMAFFEGLTHLLRGHDAGAGDAFMHAAVVYERLGMPRHAEMARSRS